MKIINLKGEIVSDDLADMYRHWGYTCTSPKDFADLSDGGEDIEVVINSRGGSVTDASEILQHLKTTKDKSLLR